MFNASFIRSQKIIPGAVFIETSQHKTMNANRKQLRQLLDNFDR